MRESNIFHRVSICINLYTIETWENDVKTCFVHKLIPINNSWSASYEFCFSALGEHRTGEKKHVVQPIWLALRIARKSIAVQTFGMDNGDDVWGDQSIVDQSLGNFVSLLF